MRLIVQENEAKEVNDKALHSGQAVVEDHDEQWASVQAVRSTIGAVVH